MSSTVRSADGTTIAYDQIGSGPALILIDAAAHYRGFSSFTGLVDRLAEHFSVFHFDRRGRGKSTDTPPYAVQREIEDIAALIERAGGSAYLYGFSSGALLALQVAAAGLTVPKLAVLEPPIEPEEDRAAQQAFTAELIETLNARGADAAVEFNLTGIGVPEEMINDMRRTPSWAAMVAVAPTLVYDCRISEASTFDLLATVRVPALVLSSTGSTEDLAQMAAVVADALPIATLRRLPGEWHGVPDDVLAPALTEWFVGPAASANR
jgi:pimeloyl-ACP methyl ester carboxylesterase